LDEKALQNSAYFPNVDANRRPERDTMGDDFDENTSRSTRTLIQLLRRPNRTFVLLRRKELKQILALVPFKHVCWPATTTFALSPTRARRLVSPSTMWRGSSNDSRGYASTRFQKRRAIL
jgi:hypothetical protein